jgi:dTDP-4-dehydrorhamnose reductase
MRVLITGAHGQVGHELMRLVPAGFEAVGLGSTELDIADAAQVTAVVDRVQPQLIINAAAYTAVDKAESEPQRAYAVNLDGVANLAQAAQRSGIPLLHISTDYVFAGDATAPYGEQDSTAPTGVYGASKLAGELALAAGCSRYMILRTSWVFGAHGNNFVKTMLRLGRERDELSVVADQQGCPTSAASIARALWTLAQQYRDSGALQWGLYHYSGMPACSWHGFAQEIFAQAHELGMLPRAPVVHGISTAQYPTPAKRPAWSVMDCSRLQQAQQITPADWRDELRAVLLELAGQ